ncbi:MAG: hypothetical protein Q4E76_01750 [Tissierellia bacterium]|nr:hypothetical protein [Tissierellia bacterium]
MKKLAMISIFALALTLVACGPKEAPDPAQGLAQDFAQLYLAQLDFTEEDWAQWEAELSQAGTIIKLDEELEARELEAREEAAQELPALYDPLKELMSQEALGQLVANGDYPYFPLKERTLDQVELVSVTKVTPDGESYDLEFVTKKGEQEIRHVLRATIGEKISYLEKPSQVFNLEEK